MLSNEEIIKICDKYFLSRGQVYSVRTTFQSMCEMSENWLKSIKKIPELELGINIDYFVKNCSFLQGALPSVSMRILMAAGNCFY